jgi:hypothetical protein
VLPYITNSYLSNTGEETKNGIGDISLLGNYNLFSGTTGITKHLLTLTAGVKLATAAATPSTNTCPPLLISRQDQAALIF